MEEIYQEFSFLLHNRLSKKIHTTEDSIRYTFFHCLTNSGQFLPSDIIVEYPLKHRDEHNMEGSSKNSHEKIDTYIPPKNDKIGLAFEFKYDREIPSGKNSPKTQNAGSIFNDVFRLASFKREENLHRYFIYVTKKGMGTYFNNSQCLADFFNLPTGTTYNLDQTTFDNLAFSFRNKVKTFVPCTIIGVFKYNNAPDFWLRIYEIIPLSH